MTFAVVNVADKRERVIGTIWADGETDAQQMARSLFQTEAEARPEQLIVRRAEEREIPLRLMN
jgi:hypothetical protein